MREGLSQEPGAPSGWSDLPDPALGRAAPCAESWQEISLLRKIGPKTLKQPPRATLPWVHQGETATARSSQHHPRRSPVH